MIEIPSPAKKALQLLNHQHFQAYLVGGFVRDTLLNKQSDDLDICTDALPHQIQACFKDYPVIETGIQHGTLTVIIEKIPIEITTFRIDKNYLDGRHPEQVEFTHSLFEDLKRRDFTVNSLCFDQNGTLLDYLNGIEDLKEGIIRAIGNPCERFEEDALRILRAIRFCAQCSFIMENETKKALFQSKEMLRKVAIERITAEFNKILLSDYAASSLIEYHDIFILFLPELHDLKQHPQAYQEMLRNLHQAFPTLTMRLAALFSTISIIRLNEQSPSENEAIFREITKRMRYSNSIINESSFLLRYQNEPLYSDDYSVKKYLNQWDQSLFTLLNYKQSLNQSSENLNEIKEKAITFLQRQDCYSLKQLQINGTDLIKLNITGQKIKILLNECLDQVMQDKLINQKDELIEYVIKRNNEN